MQPNDAYQYSVQDFPQGMLGGSAGAFVMRIASIADDLTAWGQSPRLRDRELRAFWPTEPWLAGTVYTIAARNAAYRWTLSGPDRTANVATQRLHASQFGKGWGQLMMLVSIDYLTTDNGAFIEIIRSGPKATDPVIGLAHLDSGRCLRTADPELPVIYEDRNSKLHELRPWQVISLCEMPSPIETMNGVGLCAVSRVLRTAQELRDVGIENRERIQGRSRKEIHLVGGIGEKAIEDGQKQMEEQDKNRGLLRYSSPVIMSSVKLDAPVSVATIKLGGMPEGYNEDIARKWAVGALVLAFGADYQDIAPLPGNNMGTGAQSEVLAQKARGKGAALFQKTVAHAMNWSGVLPQTVEFTWDEDDPAEEEQVARIRKLRAETRKLQLDSGEITPEVARALAVESGDLPQELADNVVDPGDVGVEDTIGEQDAGDDTAPDQTTVQEGEKAARIAPKVTPADVKRANAYWDRLMPEWKGLLDAKPDD